MAFGKKVCISPSQIIILGYLGLIFCGTGLLMLPWTTRDGLGASLGDALFTATSAITVTGLVVHDTMQYWSFFGQLVILLLIQTGGLGVVTMAIAVAVLTGQKIGFRLRWVMQESISAPQLAGIVRTTGFICRIVLCVELAGAFLLALRFCPEMGLGQGLWMALFHAVSAFCNAGFDLMGARQAYSSLTAYSADPLVCLVIAGLIITGGIGFLTLEDVRCHGPRFRHYHLQSKFVLLASAFLLVAGFCYFYCLEFSSDRWQMSESEAVLASFFQAVSPRTAGFNSVDLTALSPMSQLVTILLMLVGAAPGSTGGGFKVTTLAVLFLALVAIFLNRRDVRGFDRRVSDGTLRKASGIFMFFVLLYLTGGMLICCLDDLPLMVAFFEAASAIATVGLTLGVTPELSDASRAVLILLMYFGRVGSLTVLFAVSSGLRQDAFRYPAEEVAVG
ncbi:Trk family potassium uptake protein [Desulfovibrio sp. An276]|uniref:TrkH family potassium uptake protein n=1 Tax=Desulfovibrio sp. An276 TaxID=1965618 RepID=UPI000B367583|nr:potassium transporter TrkG [Desulfovibrio sp. An276]OUO49503.1 Trk family potassium uptake protein [Desulfovibrio sp. An276]